MAELIDPAAGDQRLRSIQVKADGAGSLVKLDSLQRMADFQAWETGNGSGQYSRLEVFAGGTITRPS